MLVVTVRFTTKPGFEQQFIERVRAQAAESMEKEANCRVFDVCQSADQRQRVFLYEVYASYDAFNEHLQTAHFKEFDTDTQPWIEQKIVELWERMERSGL